MILWSFSTSRSKDIGVNGAPEVAETSAQCPIPGSHAGFTPERSYVAICSFFLRFPLASNGELGCLDHLRRGDR